MVYPALLALNQSFGFRKWVVDIKGNRSTISRRTNLTAPRQMCLPQRKLWESS